MVSADDSNSDTGGGFADILSNAEGAILGAVGGSLTSQAKSSGVSVDTVPKGSVSTAASLPAWVTPKNVAIGLTLLVVGGLALKKFLD